MNGIFTYFIVETFDVQFSLIGLVYDSAYGDPTDPATVDLVTWFNGKVIINNL